MVVYGLSERYRGRSPLIIPTGFLTALPSSSFVVLRGDHEIDRTDDPLARNELYVLLVADGRGRADLLVFKRPVREVQRLLRDQG